MRLIRPSFDLVDVMDRVLPHDLARAVLDRLIDIDDGAAMRIDTEVPRLHPRVDHTPLPNPVGTHFIAAVDEFAFHPVGPVDLGMHRSQRALDVSGIERVICLCEEITMRERHRIAFLDRSSCER